MKERKITITLVDARKDMRWLGVLTSIVFSVVGPILLGILLDSTAMQWAGFIFGLFAILGIIYRDSKNNTFDNVEAAKARLDEFAKEGNEQ